MNTLYQLVKKRNAYVAKHNDRAAVMLRNYYPPHMYRKEDFLSTEYDLNLKPIEKELEEWIKHMNDEWGASWKIEDIFSEIRMLQDSKNAFLMYIGDFCQYLAEHIFYDKPLEFNNALMHNVRCTELALGKIGELFDVQITLQMIIKVWGMYMNLNDE